MYLLILCLCLYPSEKVIHKKPERTNKDPLVKFSYTIHHRDKTRHEYTYPEKRRRRGQE